MRKWIEKNIPDIGHCKCKGPEVETCLKCSRSSEEPRATGARLITGCGGGGQKQRDLGTACSIKAER